MEPFISAEQYASVLCNEIHTGEPGLDAAQLVEIVLDIKSYEPSIRSTLHNSVRDLVESECTIADVEQRPHIALNVRAPLTSNSLELVERIESNFKTYCKEDIGEGERRRREEKTVRGFLPSCNFARVTICLLLFLFDGYRDLGNEVHK